MFFCSIRIYFFFTCWVDVFEWSGPSPLQQDYNARKQHQISFISLRCFLCRCSRHHTFFMLENFDSSDCRKTLSFFISKNGLIGAPEREFTHGSLRSPRLTFFLRIWLFVLFSRKTGKYHLACLNASWLDRWSI